MKKLLIALLGINALLVALLTAQTVQAKVKSYDAVKLQEYSACLRDRGMNTKFPEIDCAKYKPQAQSKVTNYDAVKLTEYAACLGLQEWGGVSTPLDKCFRYRP